MIRKVIVFAGGKKSRSWFWWGINIGVLLAVGLWWWLDQQSKAAGVIKVQPLVIPQDDEPERPTSLAEVLSTTATAKTAKKTDNLKIIEGIGPRSAEVLAEAGILTFGKLATMDSDAIQAVLRAGGVRVPYPETWPEQAALAAAGNYDALRELQGKLKGGRRA